MSHKYQLLRVLGTGTFGQACLVRRKGTDGSTDRNLVVKKIELRSLCEKDLDQALTEVAILARCKHTNVIRYCEAFVENGLLHVVMEFADGGDLRQKVIQQNGVHFSEEVILDWFVQICFAVKYIHNRHILHRDLKTQNIFLTLDNIIKLGDFGISRVVHDNNGFAQTAIGTPYYLSPEICKKQPYNHKSDIWSMGCVLYELCALRVPFDASNIIQLAMKIVKCDYTPLPAKFGPILQDLTKVCLQASPEKRPSASQILSIPSLLPFVQAYVSRQNSMVRSNRAQAARSTPMDVKPDRVVSRRLPSSQQSLLHSSPEFPLQKSSKPSKSSVPLLERQGSEGGTPCNSPVPRRHVRSGGQNRPVMINRTPPGSAEIRKITLKKLEGATPKISQMILRQRSVQSARSARSADTPKGPLPSVCLYKELAKIRALSLDSSAMLNSAPAGEAETQLVRRPRECVLLGFEKS